MGKDNLTNMLEAINCDIDKGISKSEFEQLLCRPENAELVHKMGVDVIGLVDIIDFIFRENAVRLSFAHLLDLMLQLRGKNVATVKDIVDLRSFIVLSLREALSTHS